MVYGQGARRQRLQRSDETRPDVGEHAEGDIVRYQPLQIPQRRLPEGEDSNAHDRHRERGDVRLQRRSADEPGGAGDETDTAAGGKHTDATCDEEPSPSGGGQGQQSPHDSAAVVRGSSLTEARANLDDPIGEIDRSGSVRNHQHETGRR